MNNSIKYIISFFLILMSVLLFVFTGSNYNYIHVKEANTELQPIDESIIEAVSFETIVTKSIVDSLGIGNIDGAILPVFVLEKNSCTTSLNFVRELTEQTKENLLFKTPVLLFPDTKDSFAYRLLAISEIKTPFLTLQRNRLPGVVVPGKQTVLFIDFEKKEAFYKAPIPSFNTPLLHKEQLLESVTVAWKKHNQ